MTRYATLALILAVALLPACKKSSSSSSNSGTGTITATVDGTATTFSNVLIAKDTSYMGAYILTISGANALTASTPEISITVDGTSAITTGTYNIDLTNPAADVPAIAYSQGSTLVYSSDPTGAYPSQVTITSLSKTNIQGTFSGTLTLNLGNGAATKAITNGKFDVNFK